MILFLMVVLTTVQGNCPGPSRLGRDDDADEAAHVAAAEGIVRFNKYLRETTDVNEILPLSERSRKRQQNLQEIGSPSTFVLETHPWTDTNLIHGRLIWGQIQDFKERCGGSYSEDWCLPVVRFLENGIGYRELELAIMSVHTPLETTYYYPSAEQKRQAAAAAKRADDGNFDPQQHQQNDRMSYQQTLENFINIARAKK